MMRKTLPILFVPTIMIALLAGCSSNLSTTTSGTAAAGTVPVSISMTDDPPAGVQVLFFQVSLTDATLTPQTGSPVSLLSGGTPIQIDVTQLQALSAFLSTADVAAETYTGLNLTFASPQLVIYNQSDSSIASTCAVGSVCQLTPTFDNTFPLSFTSAPFPVSVSATSPLGFLIDFHLDTVIQNDLSLNLAATDGVTISTPPPSYEKGFVSGTVGPVDTSNNSFQLQTAWGRIFTVDTTGSTTYSSFPTSSDCKTAGFSCVAQGQVVQVQVSSVASGGVITASSVTYLQEATTQTAEGTIIRLTPSATAGAPPIGFDMIMHWNWANNSNFPWGGKASVTLASNATYAIDSNGFTLPTGAAYTFSGASNLAMGQNVTVTVEPGTLSNNGGGPGNNGWGPPHAISFTASAVGLDPSQMTGTITAITSPSFTLGVGGGPFFAPWPMPSANAFSFDVITTSQTSYTGFSPDSFDGLGTGDFVSVDGWLFPPATSGGTPNIVAQSVVMRPGFWF